MNETITLRPTKSNILIGLTAPLAVLIYGLYVDKIPYAIAGGAVAIFCLLDVYRFFSPRTIIFNSQMIKYPHIFSNNHIEIPNHSIEGYTKRKENGFEMIRIILKNEKAYMLTSGMENWDKVSEIIYKNYTLLEEKSEVPRLKKLMLIFGAFIVFAFVFSFSMSIYFREP